MVYRLDGFDRAFSPQSFFAAYLGLSTPANKFAGDPGFSTPANKFAGDPGFRSRLV